MCLVINKIDRLVLEVGMSPSEASDRLRAIVARVNMIVSAFASEQFISNADGVLNANDGPSPGCALINQISPVVSQ
jgi:ribosome assembly protein 1